ncbi:MAG TPA: disulfide bond formation protein DsbA [Bacteroidetes bacterium]|nr:disulfide bond formation protein DsbA [Bacteroidota bacterium]
MTVAIWSDISCPFCYMAKRQFDSALAQFEHRDALNIEWKSFELAPGLETQPDKNMNQFLAERKGISIEETTAMGEQLAASAKPLGLEYTMHTVIPVNTFKAHRILHLAKHAGLHGPAKERLFKAYFTEGKNIDDPTTLLALGEEIGLAREEVAAIMESEQFTDAVNADIQEARQLGINSVPAFVFNGNKRVLGAQGSAAFLEALDQTFREWSSSQPATTLSGEQGLSCEVGTEC